MHWIALEEGENYFLRWWYDYRFAVTKILDLEGVQQIQWTVPSYDAGLQVPSVGVSIDITIKCCKVYVVGQDYAMHRYNSELNNLQFTSSVCETPSHTDKDGNSSQLGLES